MILTADVIEELLEQIRCHGQPAVIDWTNRTFRILSGPKERKLPHRTIEYRDILFEIVEDKP